MSGDYRSLPLPARWIAASGSRAGAMNRGEVFLAARSPLAGQISLRGTSAERPPGAPLASVRFVGQRLASARSNARRERHLAAPRAGASRAMISLDAPSAH